MQEKNEGFKGNEIFSKFKSIMMCLSILKDFITENSDKTITII